jgi:hypothetical protein
VAPPREVTDELWRRGVLSWKLHAGQRILYNKFQATPNELTSYWDCARRYGKTFLLSVIGFEYALQRPNARVYVLLPYGTDAADILRDISSTLLEDCPPDIKPEYKAAERRFVFRNGSEITIRGVNSDSAQYRRGARADLVLADEIGLWEQALYTVRSILIPMLLVNKSGPGRLIIASTPPKSPTHDAATLKAECEEAGTYSKYTIYSNPMVTPEQIKQFCKAAGGENSTDWLREYMCKWVGDENSLVVPEFDTEAKRDLIQVWERPAFFRPFVIGDPGMKDKTGLLFGYTDFLKQKAVVEAELLLTRANTRRIAAEVQAKEHELGYVNTIRLFDDPGKRLTADLTDMGLLSMPAVKDKRDASIALLRSMISGRGFIIHPDCTKLVEQLESAVYNTSKKDMAQEGHNGGHFDLVACAWYLARAYDGQFKHQNPYPRGWGQQAHPVFGKALTSGGVRPAGALLAERLFGSTAAGRKLLKGRR